MFEYSLIILSTVLFGGQFIALNAYQGKNGKSFQSILLFCSLFSLTGAIVFLSLNGFRLSFSWYTLMYAAIAGVIQIVLQVAGIKALALGRVEIYTLFNVAGSMSVAYIFGITYFREEIKITHIIGVLLVLIALIVPIIFNRKSTQKPPIIFWILCLMVFLSNGFFGSVNKIHIVSGEGLPVREYMFYMYMCIFILTTTSFVAMAIFKKGSTKVLFNPWAILFAFIYGLVNSVGMFLQYSYADRIPASILFPLSNGGALLFGLIIGCIAYKKKPTLPDIIQASIAVAGMVLFII